jgi:hypothetical protein
MKAILGAVPLAEDIDGIVELRRLDGGKPPVRAAMAIS